LPEGEPIMGKIILQIFLILLNALFACAEIAVISMNDNKLAKLTASGDKRAIRLTKLIAQPARFLATIQIGITLVNLLGSAFAAENFSDRLVDAMVNLGISIPVSILNTLSVIIITLVLTYFTVTLGELVPKRIAMKKSEQLALGMSQLIYVISKIFAPVVWLLTVSANGLLRLLGINPHDEDNENTEEEIRMMIDAGSEKGTIHPDEKDMLQNIFEFDDISAGEIMTHRTEVSLLWNDETDEQWEQTIHESKHSIYPICSESPDNIIGILYSKDYFRLKDKSRENVMDHAVQPAYFIPESVKADVLFRNMKKNRSHFAVVLDEYGGMSGIVTINDLLEQLVGDLEDDITAPRELPPIERIDSSTWLIQGTTPLDEVSGHIGVLLPEDDYDTFGGFVFGILGTIPDDGSTPEVEEFGLVIKIQSIKDHRLESALVCLSESKDKATTVNSVS
jgi:putative hemolysin